MNELHRLHPKDNGGAVRRILLAVSLTSIGRRDNTPWMTEYGIQLYGSSLATLARQLQEPEGLKDDNNYVTSKLLSLYEVWPPIHVTNRAINICSLDPSRPRLLRQDQPNKEVEPSHPGGTGLSRVAGTGELPIRFRSPVVRRRESHPGISPTPARGGTRNPIDVFGRRLHLPLGLERAPSSTSRSGRRSHGYTYPRHRKTSSSTSSPKSPTSSLI